MKDGGAPVGSSGANLLFNVIPPLCVSQGKTTLCPVFHGLSSSALRTAASKLPISHGLER